MVIYESKKYRYAQCLVPVNCAENIQVVSSRLSIDPDYFVTWCNDGKPHRFCGKSIPPIVAPKLFDIWGVNEEILLSIGYRLHWFVFKDLDTGVFSIGNKPSFSRSQDPHSRKIAENMPTVDFEWLASL